MDFPYTVLRVEANSAFPERTILKRPTLKIRLAKNGRRIVVWALVDSGADTCLFPASMAKALGISIPNERALPFSGTSANVQTAYFETVQATIWNDVASEQPLTFNLYVGFCDTLEHTGFGLLGQEGFFSRFAVSFLHAENVLRIS